MYCWTVEEKSGLKRLAHYFIFNYPMMNQDGKGWLKKMLLQCYNRNSIFLAQNFTLLNSTSAFSSVLFKHGINAFFVYCSQHGGGYLHGNPAVFAGDKEFLCLKIRIKPSERLFIWVGNLMTNNHFLSCNFTCACHLYLSFMLHSKIGVQRTYFFPNWQNIFWLFLEISFSN